jgi:hypothetical protein
MILIAGNGEGEGVLCAAPNEAAHNSKMTILTSFFIPAVSCIGQTRRAILS